jgi:hypothetical protein
VDRRVTAGVAMLADQGRMDGRPLNSLLRPGRDLVPPRFQPGHALGRYARRAGADCRQGSVIGQRDLGRQPAALVSHGAPPGQLLASHQPGPGDVPVRIALAHPHQDLSILIHFEPPLTHGRLRQKSRKHSRFTKVRTPEVAPLGRKSTGAITPKFWWRHYAEIEMAPFCRKFTHPRPAQMAGGGGGGGFLLT